MPTTQPVFQNLRPNQSVDNRIELLSIIGIAQPLQGSSGQFRTTRPRPYLPLLQLGEPILHHHLCTSFGPIWMLSDILRQRIILIRSHSRFRLKLPTLAAIFNIFLFYFDLLTFRGTLL